MGNAYELIIQFIKFSAVGIIATIVDMAGLFWLKETVGFGILLSSGLSFSFSVIVNYLLSMRFVFEGKDKNKGREFIVFILLSVIGLVLNQFIMWAGSSFTCLYYMWVKVIATIIVLLYNFISRKIFIEKH